VGDLEKEGTLDGGTREVKQKGFWSRFNFGNAKMKNATSRQLIRIPARMRWLFTKGKFQEVLDRFIDRNNKLDSLVPTLLDGFGYFENKKLQERLKSDGTVNMFQGHLMVSKLAVESDHNASANGVIENGKGYMDASSE